MKKIIFVWFITIFISCTHTLVRTETSIDEVMISPVDGHFANQTISLHTFIRYERELAYFEGQKDALTESIRIEKLEGCEDGWRWIQSPWDDGSEPVFIPPMCLEN